MFGRRNLPFVALALALASPAVAQTTADDLARCEQLYALYWRYRDTGGESRQGSSHQGALEAQRALEKCRHGNTKDGIRELERKVGTGGVRR
jgi:hypothetical protein